MVDLGSGFQSRPLADFLPAVTIAAKNLADKHVQNNKSIRLMLGERGIMSEEDLKKLKSRDLDGNQRFL